MLKIRIFIIFYFILFIFFSSKIIAQDFRSNNLNFNKAELIKIFEDIDLIEEISFFNSIIYRGNSPNIYKDHAKSIVYVNTDSVQGSGVVISSEGEILTNAHVIENAKDIYTIFKPQKGGGTFYTEIHKAEVIKIDPKRDLALIKPLYPPDEIIPITIEKSEDLEFDFVGTGAHCIGHPDGRTWTYTKGVISAYRPNHEWTYDEVLLLSANVFQIDCSINPGNSGGALISDHGTLLGINTSMDQNNVLINFSVSSNELIDFINSDDFPKPKLLEDVLEIAKGDPIFVKGEKYNESTGYYDIEHWDYDKNGIVDTIRHFLDNDNLPDMIQYDDNENGLIDSTIKFLANGTREHYFDIDEDGVDNYLFIDLNNDGNYEVKKKI